MELKAFISIKLNQVPGLSVDSNKKTRGQRLERDSNKPTVQAIRERPNNRHSA